MQSKGTEQAWCHAIGMLAGTPHMCTAVMATCMTLSSQLFPLPCMMCHQEAYWKQGFGIGLKLPRLAQAEQSYHTVPGGFV